MRLTNVTPSDGKDTKQKSRFGGVLLEGLGKAKFGIAAAAMMTAWASGVGYSVVDRTPAPQKVHAFDDICKEMVLEVVTPRRSRPASELDWKKTHLIVINADTSEVHKKNALSSVKAGLENKAAGVYVAGLDDSEVAGAKHYDTDSSGMRSMLEEVRKNSADGDTVMLYITGHGVHDNIASEDGEKVDHRILPRAMRKLLGQRNIILVSDKLFCPCFLGELLESERFASVSLITPGFKNEALPCDLFTLQLWHAIGAGLDLNGDGRAELEEAFQYAMRGWHTFEPNANGAYRRSIRKITKMEEVKDGVVMVSANWCKACQKMLPVFKEMNFLFAGNGGFYLIDSGDSDYSGAIPAIIIVKDGKPVTASVGALSLETFAKWLYENGKPANRFEFTLKHLFEERRLDSIARITDWDGMSKEFGAEISVNILNSLLKHDDSFVRMKVIMGLGGSANLSMREIENMGKLLGDKEPEIREAASIVFGTAARKNPQMLVPYLKSLAADNDENVRQGAEKALKMISGEEVYRNRVEGVLL